MRLCPGAERTKIVSNGSVNEGSDGLAVAHGAQRGRKEPHIAPGVARSLRRTRGGSACVFVRVLGGNGRRPSSLPGGGADDRRRRHGARRANAANMHLSQDAILAGHSSEAHPGSHNLEGRMAARDGAEPGNYQVWKDRLADGTLGSGDGAHKVAARCRRDIGYPALLAERYTYRRWSFVNGGCELCSAAPVGVPVLFSPCCLAPHEPDQIPDLNSHPLL